MIAFTFFGACAITVLSFAADDDAGRMIAVTMVTGAYGTMLGDALRARWQDSFWLAPYAPVNIRRMRKLETCGALPDLIRVGVIGLLMAVFGCIAGWPYAALKALPVAAAAMVTGMIFSSGRWGKIMLWTSGIGATAWSASEIMQRQLVPGAIGHGYLHGWLPAFPWSLWAGNWSHILPRLLVFSAAMVVVFFEWRKAWRGADIAAAWNPQPQEIESDLHEEWAEPNEPHEITEADDPRPALRYDARAAVTQGWVGLAAYVHFDHVTWIDKWLWKSLDPRQRMLCCLGIYGTRLWLRRVRSAGILLAVSVALFWTFRLSMQHHLGPTMAEYGVLVGLPALGFAIIAFACSGPGKHSTLEPWTGTFNPGLQRSISPLAIFPITPGEWERCAVKEWLVRASFVALIWSIAAVAAALIFLNNPSLRELLGWFIAPWLLWAAMLPCSVGGRLLRAHYGSTQGIVLGSWLFLSFMMMAISPAAIVVAIIGFALRHFPTFAGGMAFAAVAGWAGLRFAVASCRNLKADVAYEAAGKPQ
jgi:Flp pilus assembly pilin Flp